MEVERLVNNSYIKAKEILKTNMALLHHLAAKLVEQEVVSSEEFQIMLIEFKANTARFDIIGSNRRREDLPFQELP